MTMNITRKAGIALLVLGACSLTAKSAQAQIVTFTAADPGAGPGGSFPNSDAEAAVFDAAVGSDTVVNFESAPVGSFTSLTIAPGVTLTGTDFTGKSQSIQNRPAYLIYDPSSSASLYGFDTTPGGSNYLNLYGGTATFSFTSPIQAFGAYFTGVQYTTETITFSDGSNQILHIPNPGSGAEFLGFTDAGKSISALTLNADVSSNSADIIGVDDVRFGSLSSSTLTPEPSSLSVLALGGLGLFGLAWRTRRRCRMFALLT